MPSWSQRIGNWTALRAMFRLVWWRWMRDCKVIRVTGWRSCLFDTRSGQRMRGTMCIFPWD